MKNGSNFRMVFVTTESYESAKQIAKILVSEKLAACCSIINQTTSIFEWEGKTVERLEFILLIKTAKHRIDELEKRILDLHHDEVPEILAVKVKEGLDKYLDWVDETVQKQNI
mgnify:CR=1 FL=1